MGPDGHKQRDEPEPDVLDQEEDGWVILGAEEDKHGQSQSDLLYFLYLRKGGDYLDRDTSEISEVCRSETEKIRHDKEGTGPELSYRPRVIHRDNTRYPNKTPGLPLLSR